MSIDILKVVIFALMGGYATFLANRTIAVYHDGLRPIMPDFISGKVSHREMLGISFAISIGFITGFAMPITMATGIIVVHIVLLAADIIGVSVKNSVVSVVLGTLWGGAVPVLLDTIIVLFDMLPVSFLDALASVGDPIVAAFVAFPAITVAYQFGKKKGFFTFAVSLLGRIVIEFVNPVIIAGNEVSLSAEGIAMLCGMVCLIAFAATDKSRGVDLGDSLFADNVARIRGNIKYLIPMGIIISIAANYHWIAGEPIAAAVLAKGDIASAAIVAFVQAVAFLPLVITTALVSGVYATNGWCDWLEGFGYIAPNPIVAGALGGLAMGVEVLSLNKIGSFLNRFPALKMSGDNIRTAMTMILEVALLVGGINAGSQIWGATGIFIVVGLYVLNEVLNRPVIKMAAAPLAAIIVGILANVAAVLGILPM